MQMSHAVGQQMNVNTMTDKMLIALPSMSHPHWHENSET